MTWNAGKSFVKMEDLAYGSHKEKMDLAEDALAKTDRLLSSKFFSVYKDYHLILDKEVEQYKHCLRAAERVKLKSLMKNPNRPFNRKHMAKQSSASMKKDAIYTSQTLFELNSENFENLVEGGQVIADKTMFLSEFFKAGNKKIIVTMPRGFGKTTLLTMTKAFFGIPVDSRGIPFKDVKQSPAYKLFTSKHRTKIFTENASFFSEHFGQYPVVYITLQNVVGPSNKILCQFKNALQQTYMDFQYVYDELKLRIKKDEATSQEARDCAFMKQVGLCSSSLRLDSTRSFVLVDEYDTLAMASARRETSKSVVKVVQHALSSFLCISKRQQQNDDKARHEDVRDFFNQFLDHTFKGNPNISHAIIAGIIPVVSDSLSGLSYDNCNMYRNQFAPFFGFTEAEIVDFARILEDKQVELTAGWRNSLKNYYNGYVCHKDYGTNGIKLYNPRNVSCFINKCATNEDLPRPQPFWNNDSAGVRKLKNFFQHEKLAGVIDKLVAQETIPYHLTHHIDFTVEDYEEVLKMQDQGDSIQIPDKGVQLFLNYLYHTGYLTVLSSYLGEYYIRVYGFSDKLANAVTIELRNMTTAKHPEEFLESLCTAFQTLMMANKVKRFTESYPYGVFNYLASRMMGIDNRFHEIEERMNNGAILRPDLTYAIGDTIMTIKKKFGLNGTATIARDEALNYRKVHEQRDRQDGRVTQRFISLGVHIAKNKKVTMEIFVENGTTPHLSPRSQKHLRSLPRIKHTVI
uniref:AAA-ATPase-like domain-containing protein n=1 Tax=Ditylenchus dipsaci TaxID=166011 RepID=A0A915E198_9BILA